MAVFPCDWQPHRYAGPQRSVYVTWICHELVQAHKLRLCSRHFLECGEVVAKYMSMIDDDSQMSDNCEECGKPKEAAVYAKMFPEKAPADDWAGDFCGPCSQRVLDHLKVANGRRLPDRSEA